MKKRSRRGFAGLSPDKLKALSSKGGKTAHDKGKAHRFSATEAEEAGRKGGEKVSQDRDHMRRIGQKGGKATRQSKNRNQNAPKTETP